jgi:hypothetical protein
MTYHDASRLFDSAHDSMTPPRSAGPTSLRPRRFGLTRIVIRAHAPTHQGNKTARNLVPRIDWLESLGRLLLMMRPVLAVVLFGSLGAPTALADPSPVPDLSGYHSVDPNDYDTYYNYPTTGGVQFLRVLHRT